MGKDKLGAPLLLAAAGRSTCASPSMSRDRLSRTVAMQGLLNLGGITSPLTIWRRSSSFAMARRYVLSPQGLVCYGSTWLTTFTHCAPVQISNDYPDLNDQGYFRADNLYKIFGHGAPPPGTYNTPDVIYAMKKGEVGLASCHDWPRCQVTILLACVTMTVAYGRKVGVHVSMQKRRNSNRPYETVKPLAEKLGMDPVMDERTPTKGGVFDNTYLEGEHKAGTFFSALCRCGHSRAATSCVVDRA